ncbi:DUF5305 domain-containing protein [Halobacterium sp. R2-5]|uniref:DUF5305 domain-containing protein n=1 Tax=Halobacterium sp. R2-5 TaxID=2715751 RepID=UPI00141FB9A3|nr:DUF5305 domain-containing protein [Halobacterium sp. R2-5]NIB98097.1 DUF5305 domain-containing protein [Halobacterium sp. R2-5]
MGEGTRWLRARAIVSSWLPVLVAALAVLAVAGGWAMYTAHAVPGTTQEQSERVHWTVSGEFQHGADVTRENPVFDVGTTLANRSTYFTGASPELDGRYVATYSGVGAPAASIALNATLVVRAVGENTVYWTDRTPLDETSADAVQSGESASVAFSLNATRIAQRQSEIQDSLGQTPGDVEAFVAVDTAVDGTADGQPASLSLTHRLPVSVDGDTYTVGPAETGSEPMTTTETVTVTNDYGPLWTIGGPLLFLGGVGGLAVLGAGRSRDAFALSPEERDLLAFRDDRAEFDEWVVRARLPEAVRDRPHATAESLSDVVDFAIDSDTAVVEDSESGTFYVVADQLLVVYEPPVLARGHETSGGVAGLGLLESTDEQTDLVETSQDADGSVAESEETTDNSDDDADREESPRPQD